MPARSAAELLKARLSGEHPCLLSVGLMTADLGRLNDEVASVTSAGAEMVHFDVMDGHFSGPLTLGPAAIRSLSTDALKDVHLLVDDPVRGIEAYVDAGADVLTFHVEAARQPRPVLRRMAKAARSTEKGEGIVRGVAVNPSTPLEAVEPLLEELDYILLLGIDPGWPGQGFAPTTPRRLERLRLLIEHAGASAAIGLDGGISRDNIGAIADLGPDVVVAGSAVFDGKAAAANARGLLAVLSRAGSGRSRESGK